MSLRIASIGYATEQGLGRLMKSFFDARVVTDPIIYRHSSSSRVTNLNWYPTGTQVVGGLGWFRLNSVRQALSGVQILLAWETFFDWSVVDYCRQKGVKTVLIPMYEWTPKVWPQKPDMVICPSLLDYDYFKGQFPEGRCVFLPVPVRTDLWKQRTTALRYLHNAGNVGHREHKGTRQLLEAAKLLTRPIDLTVRGQDVAVLKQIVKDVFGTGSLVGWGPTTNIGPERGPWVRFEYREVSYEDLWNGYDVYVAPEKLNGLSLPLQEARAAGLLVLTTDRYPANTWLPREAGPLRCPMCRSSEISPSVELSREARKCSSCSGKFWVDEGARDECLIPVDRYEKARISSSYLEFDEAVVRPEDIAATMDAWHEKDISSYSLSGREWAEANSWSALKGRWLEALKSCLT